MCAESTQRRSTHAFPDGSTVSGEARYVDQAIRIRESMEGQRTRWIAQLRERGVKAAHPDDGWVDRDKDTVHLCYPDFNDGLAVGDPLALGSPWGDTRIVRVTGTSENRFAVGYSGPWYWHFADETSGRPDNA